MKKYNVEMKIGDIYDNPATGVMPPPLVIMVDDYTGAESEEEAVELMKQWLIDNGMDADDVKNAVYQVSE